MLDKVGNIVCIFKNTFKNCIVIRVKVREI
jgi:hypothetical protein